MRPVLCRRSERTSASNGRVFSTCSGSSHARLATVTPHRRVLHGRPGVRVARNHDGHAGFARQCRMHVAQIEPVGLRIDLERHAVFPPPPRRPRRCRAGRRSRRSSIRPVGCPRCPRAGCSIALQHTRGHLRALLIERRVHGATTMSRAARQSSSRSSVPSARMSHSMPARTRTPRWPSNARMRAACASARRFVQAVGHGERLAVISDGNVFEPGVGRGVHHRFDRVLAVGLRRVHVKIAAKVASRDEPRKGVAGCPRDLAAILAQLRRDRTRDPARRRSPLRSSRPRANVVVRAEESVLVQLQSALHRPVPERDVVRFRTGEILHAPRRGSLAARAAGPPGTHPQKDARLCVAVAEHALDAADGSTNASIRRRFRRRGARMSMSPQVSHPRRRLPTASMVAPGEAA